MNTQNIIIDISKPDVIMPMVTIGQGDASGTTIVASIYDNGTEVSLAGKSAMLEVRLPDGKSYVRDANCTVSGNKITYVVDEEHVGAVAGVTDDAYFDVLDGPTVIYSTNRFRLRILRSARTDAKPAESWDTEVDAMIARGDAAIAAGVAEGQSRITAAITEFDTRQDQNDTAQAENNLEQAKNNADQAENNRSAQGLVSQVLTSGQYDPVNRRPTITGELGKIYLVPKEDASTSDGYYEWMWIGSKWEQIGITQTTIVGITTDEIDAVIEGEGGTGNQTLNLTGLNYLWLKEVDYFDDNYSGITTKTTTGPAYGPLVSVTAEGYAEQDGTPTPSDPKEIRVVRGRNLLDVSTVQIGKAWNGATNNARAIVNVSCEPNTTYTISNAGGTVDALYAYEKASSTDTVAIANYDLAKSGTRTITTNANTRCITIQHNKDAITVGDVESVKPQLELGSTAHPYVPYGHVGLDVTADGTTTTTPIPLPSRGWVGSLPDGTHDALSIDGAGKVTWELADAMDTFDGSEDWTFPGGEFQLSGWRAANNALRAGVGYATHSRMASTAHIDGTIFVGDDLNVYYLSVADSAAAFKTWLQSNPVTMLYPLATPTTVEVGYVDLPDIPEGAVVSMPELEGLGVESWTSDAVADYTSAVVGKVNTNGAAITPASVTATGAVSGSSISDSVGSLAQLRDSVARVTTTTTNVSEAQIDQWDDNGLAMQIAVRGTNGYYSLLVYNDRIVLLNAETGTTIKTWS